MSEYDPHDPDSVDEEQAFANARDQFRVDAWSHMIRDARGRIVLADILAQCGILMTSYVPGQPDHTAYLEGRRSIGLAIHNQIGLQHSEFIADIEKQLRRLVADVGYGGSGERRGDSG